MTKTSKRTLVAIALTLLLVVFVAGGVMAAGPNGNCTNGGVCQNDGEGTGDGIGLQTRTQANTAWSYQNQYNNQFNSNGNCYANQYRKQYRYGYGLIPE